MESLIVRRQLEKPSEIRGCIGGLLAGFFRALTRPSVSLSSGPDVAFQSPFGLTSADMALATFVNNSL